MIFCCRCRHAPEMKKKPPPSINFNWDDRSTQIERESNINIGTPTRWMDGACCRPWNRPFSNHPIDGRRVARRDRCYRYFPWDIGQDDAKHEPFWQPWAWCLLQAHLVDANIASIKHFASQWIDLGRGYIARVAHLNKQLGGNANSNIMNGKKAGRQCFSKREGRKSTLVVVFPLYTAIYKWTAILLCFYASHDIRVLSAVWHIS